MTPFFWLGVLYTHRGHGIGTYQQTENGQAPSERPSVLLITEFHHHNRISYDSLRGF